MLWLHKFVSERHVQLFCREGIQLGAQVGYLRQNIRLVVPKAVWLCALDALYRAPDCDLNEVVETGVLLDRLEALLQNLQIVGPVCEKLRGFCCHIEHGLGDQNSLLLVLHAFEQLKQHEDGLHGVLLVDLGERLVRVRYQLKLFWRVVAKKRVDLLSEDIKELLVLLQDVLDQLYLRLVQRDFCGIRQLLLDNLIELVLVVDYVLRSVHLLDDDVYDLVEDVLEELLEHVLLPPTVLLQVELAKINYVHLQLLKLQVLSELLETEHKVS